MPTPLSSSDTLIQALHAIVGQAHVLQPDAVDGLDRHLHDWRGRYQGRALAVVRPGNTDEVARIVQACAARSVAIVPQGGNTSLVGGSVPDDSGTQIVLHLGRLQQVRGVDAANLSITVDAGCTLAQVQQAADDAGLLFPLSLASEGSCTIGGNLASNAGGTQVLRYGTARELCLGLEAVTAQGEIWHGLQGLRKDNSGYDLRDLLIGSEGTLGIITAATLKLYPRPKGQACALVACPDAAAAVSLLQQARLQLDAGLTAFEAMAPLPLRLVRRHHPAAAAAVGEAAWQAVEQASAWLVLIEHVSIESPDHAEHRLHTVLSEALAQGLITEASLASNLAQQQALWRLRETIPLAEKAEGLMVKHDIGVPSSAIPAFVHETAQAIAAQWDDARIVCFGHLGDGNLHYNVQPPAALSQGPALATFEAAVNQIVFDQVQRFGGTLSAEHGIGALRCGELARRKSPVALSMMRAIKLALDPQGILNPGRVLG
ncbi:MAG: FAD-binding oxidoreductase [Aquabacterium sp.]